MNKPGFRIDLHHKEMDIAAARAQGCGFPDHSALLKVTEALNAPS
jgi:3-hydroxyisobutyrate dehydrogenase-like beta-hydroxyacid dehydrogenase